MMSKYKVYPDTETVAQAAADYLFQQISNCVAENGQCHVVLPGGSTPARCLQLLAEKPLPWQDVHWYPGDERCYPVGNAERNDTMIAAKLFPRHKNNTKNLHSIPAELGPQQGAARYAVLLDSISGLDIVVLGMGEDGHTASLFPGNAALEDQRMAVPVYDAAKPPRERVSIGLNMLRSAGERIIIATGENKREALKKIDQGETLPVARIEPDVCFVDEAAVDTIDDDL
jgi:6-phosphogluconolactonase